jgi:hypothetical protein
MCESLSEETRTDRILASWSRGDQLAGFGIDSKLPILCVFLPDAYRHDNDLIRYHYRFNDTTLLSALFPWLFDI